MNNTDGCLTMPIVAAIAATEIDDAELKRWELHLESCPACCKKLDTLSADELTWESCRSFLPDDPHDKERFTCNVEAGGESSDSAELLRFLAPTDDPHMLGRLGTYEIAGIIGVGGMGIVLKALDPALSRFVALKVLAPRFWKDAQARERFAREARAAASIVHDNVIEIYGVAEVNGIPFLTMPYLRGDSLQKRIDRHGPLQVDEVLRVAMQVAAGLAAAHAQGLVHRDVKPANILLSDGAERVRITDFGIARLAEDPRITQTGLVSGTPQYMSPEQVRGEQVDCRSDLFSLGSVIYAMCTGRLPFESKSNYELLNQVVAAKPRRMEDLNPSIPSWLAAIVSKLHSASPSHRYQSAEQLATQLEQCLAFVQQPEALSPPRTVTRLDARYRRRHRPGDRTLLLGGLLMFVLVLIGVVFLGGMLWAPPDSTAADPVSVRGRLVDGQGAPVTDTMVLAVQKTWPNNRYRQEMLSTKSDKDGNFVFDKFGVSGQQYAFLVTAISSEWSMTSEYRVVKDGQQQDLVTLTVEKSKPVTIQLRDSGGNPVPNVRVLPTRRKLKEGTEYLSYPQHVGTSGFATDEKGEVRFASWKPGEQGAIVYQANDEIKTLDFTVSEDRVVSLTVAPATPKPTLGPPVHVAGRVIDTSGSPVAAITVLAIQKTWPNNRYRQDALTATTDADGKFRFDKFASSGSQYAFLLTVIAEGYAMTSEYQVVENGSQQEEITLTVERSEPVVFVFQDSNGTPLPGVDACPSDREVDKSTTFLNYSMHMKNAGKPSDEQGQLTFTAWKPGEAGSIYYRYQEKYGESKFKIGADRRVTVTIPTE